LNDTLNLLFAFVKKKKYNSLIIMTDRLKPPVEFNLGRKTLGDIVKGLEDLGWRTNKAALQVYGDPVMFFGNLEEAKFRHRPAGRGRGHVDKLSFTTTNNKLIRQCPDDGSEVLSSNEVVQS